MADITKQLLISIDGYGHVPESGGLRVHFTDHTLITLGYTNNEISFDANNLQGLIDTLKDIKQRRDIALADKANTEAFFKERVGIGS